MKDLSHFTPEQIKNTKFPLEWYKENVNLIDFAKYVYGYEINYKHTSKIIDNTTSWVSMEHPETNDHIIITLSSQENKNEGDALKKSPHFYYMNSSPDSQEPVFGTNKFDQGSIFDFIQFRDQLSLGDSIRKIKTFLVTDYSKVKDTPNVLRLSSSKPVPKGKDLFPYYNVKPIDTQNIPFYISNVFKFRDLPVSILNDNKFKNHIFYREYINAKNQKFTSLCFPIISPEKEVGFFSVSQVDKQNGSFKEILGFKKDGGWFSGFDKSKQLDKLIITENPVDAISHYILNPQLKNQNVLYFSTIGTVSQYQCRSIDRIIETFKPTEIIGACDLDAAGQKFNCFIAGQLEGKNDQFHSFTALQNTNKHHQASLNVSYSCGSLEDNLRTYRAALLLIESMNQIHKDKVTEGQPFSLHLNASNENNLNFTLNFYSIKDNWLLATEFLASFKNNQAYSFKIDTPVNKDWNEDLSSVKNLFDYYKSFEKDNPKMVPDLFKGIASFEEFAGIHYQSEYKSEILTKKTQDSEKELIQKIKTLDEIQESTSNGLLGKTHKKEDEGGLEQYNVKEKLLNEDLSKKNIEVPDLEKHNKDNNNEKKSNSYDV